MNNQQFRRLVLDTPARQDGATTNSSSTPRPGATPSTLGSKRSSFIPMTPRSVKGGPGVDFARQMAERNAESQPTKKFRAQSAPKGVKLAKGYQDRTLERQDSESDEKAARIKALEEQMKLGQLDSATFEALRDQITGGELSATHLVKGLDRQLLDRVRRGEVVMGEEETESGVDIDEELDKLEEQEIGPIEREKVVKKGEMAPPPPVAGSKRNRDAILAELKAQRKAAAEARLAARPELGSQFRDISAPRTGTTRTERDSRGREVLITVDEHGKVKKKVRKFEASEPITAAPPVVEKAVKFLDEGITIPITKSQSKEVEEEKDDDDDIFADVGSAYDPLGDLSDDDDDEDESSDEEGQISSKAPKSAAEDQAGLIESRTPFVSKSPAVEQQPDDEARASMPPPPLPPTTTTTSSRNYFKTPSLLASNEDTTSHNPFNDAAFLAAIKKAGAISNISLSLGESNDDDADVSEEAKEARLRRRAEMLAGNDRDLDDMDMGFGSSRFGDAEDAEEGGSKIKLSEWKGGAGADDDEDEGNGKGGGEKKKRSRKRKGDKNSAKDVLGVLERRKDNGK